MAGPIDLLDVNVWLALGITHHQHHGRALSYWERESSPFVGFCRVTALGFLRLCSQPAVTGNRPLTTEQAWSAYLALRGLPEVRLLHEPMGVEPFLQSWSSAKQWSPRYWTDAYLAAFAISAGLRMVTFDRDFEKFEGLSLLLLKS